MVKIERSGDLFNEAHDYVNLQLVVAFSSHTTIGGGGEREIFDESVPACAFFFLSGNQFSRTTFTF